MSEWGRSAWPEPRDLYLDAAAAADATEASRECPSWDLQPRQLCELELLLSGALAPLDGYPDAVTRDRIARDGRLPGGQPFPWPLRLLVSPAFAEDLAAGDRIALRDAEGLLIALMTVSQLEPEDGGIALAGPVQGIEPPCHYDFGTLRSDPATVRERLQRLGWRRILGVVTDRPIGPGEHALVTRRARELEASVLLLPEGGMPDPGDARYYARLRALEAVLPRFPEQTTEAVLLPLPRLAGIPGERGLRHLVARNHGATHVLLLDEDEDAPAEDLAALDHALGIEAVPGGRPVHLPDRGRWCLPDEVPAGETARDADAGTLVERLQRGERIPEWLGWPEQCAHLARAWPPRVKQGFTLFLTGLSGSGKSTIARALLGRLMEEGSRRVTLLDGDIVRKNLSSELGFSREHRNLNILRIGFVASEITKNGGVAICAPIAPYAATRHAVREAVEAVGGFVEVHVATPLEVCEARDRKGLYARARAGLIKEFTGISDPYEEPVDPELRIDTTEMSPDEAAQQVLLKLAALGYLA
jgi:sulfate adenylyltransferase